jgi:hypothetical protein
MLWRISRSLLSYEKENGPLLIVGIKPTITKLLIKHSFAGLVAPHGKTNLIHEANWCKKESS